MKKLIAVSAIALLTATGSASAADAKAGEAAYNNNGCGGCHGAGGNSAIPNNPKLNGQHAVYIESALKQYAAKSRSDATMQAMAALLSDADKANVAAYLAAQ